jgi:hypothetical protein
MTDPLYRILLLYFAEIITPLMVETNHYSYCSLDILGEGPSLLPDITEAP